MLRFALVAVLCLSHVATAQYSEITFFGDSLSDVGNINSITLGLVPGGDYYQGRFSNGPVYAEQLAEKLDLGPLVRSSDGGRNYAYGGAQTTGTGFLDGGLFIEDLDEQVDDYLSNRTPGDNELLVILIGGNDFILGGASNGSAIADRAMRQIDRLINAGAKNLLSLNIPLLGDTPRGRPQQELLNSRSRAFNSRLAERLGDTEIEGLSIHQIDVAELFSVILESPGEFGFTNTTEEGIRVSDASGYLFWDDIHPTTEAHSLLAEASLATLQGNDAFGGDFNLDGSVTSLDVDLLSLQIVNDTMRTSFFDLDQDGILGAEDIDLLLAQNQRINGDADFNGEVGFPDFLTLSASFGRSDSEVRWSHGDFDSSGSVGFPDFLVLSRNFGKTTFDTVADEVANMSVPEPTVSGVLVMCWLFLACWFVRKR